MTLRPALPDTGIVFRRTDLPQAGGYPRPRGERRRHHVGHDPGKGEARVSTVEHLLSAFAGLGIDNALVEVSAAEVPIMDGSAGPFVFLLQSAGIEEQRGPKRFIRSRSACESRTATSGRTSIPSTASRSISRSSSITRCSKRRSQKASDGFFDDLVPARRSAGRARSASCATSRRLRSHNLALGGNLDNAIVLDDFRVLNEDGLRYEDEFVKHKILDAIGDLYLLGHSLIGEFSGHKSGHALNNKLLRMLLADPTTWEEVSFDSYADAPISYIEAPALPGSSG